MHITETTNELLKLNYSVYSQLPILPLDSNRRAVHQSQSKIILLYMKNCLTTP